MDIFIEIKDEDRASCKKYLDAVDKAKKFIKKKISNCETNLPK